MKGGALAILLGKPKGKPEDMEEEGEEGSESEAMDEGLKASARDAMDALKADDEEAFAAALKSFMEQC